MDHDTCVVMIAKGNHRWAVVYPACDSNEARRQIGRWASDPEMPFTWYDASKLCDAIRKHEAREE